MQCEIYHGSMKTNSNRRVVVKAGGEETVQDLLMIRCSKHVFVTPAGDSFAQSFPLRHCIYSPVDGPDLNDSMHNHIDFHRIYTACLFQTSPEVHLFSCALRTCGYSVRLGEYSN